MIHYIELARVSTEGQDDRKGKSRQFDAFDLLAKSRPGTLVYRADETLSGATPNALRAELQKVFALLRAGKANELRVHSQDRLTRSDSASERAEIWSVLKDSKAKLVLTNGREIDPANDTSGGAEIEYAVTTIIAGKEKLAINKRFSEGRYQAAKRGRAVGRAPYGRRFDQSTREWCYSDEAPIYRGLFDAVLQGLSITQICDDLNTRKVPSPAHWCVASLRRIIAEEGKGLDPKIWEAIQADLSGDKFGPLEVVLKLNSEQVRVPFSLWHTSAVWKQINSPSATGIVTWRGVPTDTKCPIVTAEVQAAAIKMLSARRTQTGPRGLIPALLRKMMKCGICGAGIRTDVLYSRWHKKVTSKHTVYYCPKNCLKSGPHADVVDRAVKTEYVLTLSNPERLQAAREALKVKTDDLDESREAIRAKVARASAVVAKLSRAKAQALKANEAGLIEGDEFLASLKSIKTKLDAAQGELDAAQGELGEVEVSQVSAETEAKVLDLSTWATRNKGAADDFWRALLERTFRAEGSQMFLLRDKVIGIGVLNIVAILGTSGPTDDAPNRSAIRSLWQPVGSELPSGSEIANSANSLVPFRFEAALTGP